MCLLREEGRRRARQGAPVEEVLSGRMRALLSGTSDRGVVPEGSERRDVEPDYISIIWSLNCAIACNACHRSTSFASAAVFLAVFLYTRKRNLSSDPVRSSKDFHDERVYSLDRSRSRRLRLRMYDLYGNHCFTMLKIMLSARVTEQRFFLFFFCTTKISSQYFTRA